MRQWVYEKLSTSPLITSAFASSLGVGEPLADRVFGKNSMQTSRVRRPFIVYGMGVQSAERLHDQDDAARQFLQIWVHDDPADYQLIDDVISAIIKEMVGSWNAQHRVFTILYLETSQEFDDQTLGTIFRYVRLQAVRGDIT